jgi:hypothetical protein
VSRYSASSRESAEFPTGVRNVVAMFVNAWGDVHAWGVGPRMLTHGLFVAPAIPRERVVRLREMLQGQILQRLAQRGDGVLRRWPEGILPQ